MIKSSISLNLLALSLLTGCNDGSVSDTSTSSQNTENITNSSNTNSNSTTPSQNTNIEVNNSSNSNSTTTNTTTVSAKSFKGDNELLLAWSETGMHCMDSNFSVFALLPPSNNLRAVIIKRGSNPSIISDQKIAFSSSTNTESSSKTDFWNYAKPLFGVDLRENLGLNGFFAPSKNGQNLEWNDTVSIYHANGIPITPWNDDKTWNPYQTVNLSYSSSSENLSASAVLPVSDEVNCKSCHSGNGEEDYKFNILKQHDQKHDISTYLSQLKNIGYEYGSSLYTTAKNGTPILCASCHKSNGLGTSGIEGIPQLTTAMHSAHQKYFSADSTLPVNTKNTCYSCHPGEKTECSRGAMSDLSCANCHGSLQNVAKSSRNGWVDEPKCQNCHDGATRHESVFSDEQNSTIRTATNTKYSTESDKLYKDSKGHGNLLCQTCHGSQHSIYPSKIESENSLSIAVQGYKGTVSDCSACHKTVPNSSAGGPHGMHSTNQWWVNSHENYAKTTTARKSCAECHGSDYRGSELSKIKIAKSFTAERTTKTYKAGDKVGCYDCHNGF